MLFRSYPNPAPVAQAIVPNVSRMAAALRAAGGRVVWIQTDSREATAKWSNHQKYKLTPERAAARLRLLSDSHDGFKLYPELEAQADDLYVRKIMFSAILPNSGDLDRVLRQHGIENLLIAGTKTNVCCEATARAAWDMDFSVVMVSDCCAALSDQEHLATLNSIIQQFGDVLTTDETLARLHD